MDLRVTRTYKVLKVDNAYNTKTQIFQGGRSSYNVVVSLKLTTPTIQRFRYRSFRVDAGDTSVYSVLKDQNAYNAKIQTFQGGRSRYKLIVNAYNTNIQKFQGGPSRYKLIM